MAVVSEMLIRIAADTAQLRSQMQQAEQAVGGSLNGIKNVATQARNALIGFFAIDKATELASTFIKTADAMALTAARLKLVTSSQKEYEAVQRDVYRIAQQNSIGLEEMSQLYTKLHDPVKRLGGTTAETTKITESFALALRVGGANTAEAASATLQFAQAMASGKLSGDEFRSIAEASPRFMKALADGMGVPIEKLKQLGSESKLTADVVGNALMKSLGALQQEAQGLPDTVGGAFTRLKNDVSLFAVELNNATGATGGLAEIISLAAEWVKQITAVFKAWGDSTKGTTDQLDLAGIAMRVLGTIFETLIVIGAEVAYVVKGIAKTFADVATLAKAFADGGLDGLSAAYKRVTAENEATLEAHKKFTAGVVGATDRVLQQREALKNNSLSAAENANEMARLTGRHGTLQTAVLKSTASNEEATKAEAKRVAEVKKLMDGLEDQTGALLASEQATDKLTKAEQTALKVMQDLQQGRIKLTDAEKRALVASLELLLATEKRINADKDLAEAKRKVAEHSAKLTDAEWKEVEALREGNVNLMKQNEVLRIGEAAVRTREAAVLRSRATDLEWAAANRGGNAALKEQARLLRQRADLIEEGNVLQAAKDTADEWKRTAENIEKGLTDSLMRAFESGKDFGKALRDGLVSMFKTTILQPTIRAIMAPVTGAIGSLMGGPAQAGGGGGGFDLLGAGSTLGSMFGAGGLSGALMAGAGWMTGATTLGGALGAAGSLIGTGTMAGTMSGLAMGAGALGPIALGIAAVYSIVKGMDDSGTPHMGGVGSYSAAGGSLTGTAADKFVGFDLPRTDWISEASKGAADISKGVVNMLDSIAGTFGKGTGYNVGTGFMDDSSRDGAWGALKIALGGQTLVDWARGNDKWPGREFADGEQGLKEYNEALAVSVRSALDSIGLPSWATGMLDALGEGASIEQLNQAVDAINATKRALDGMGSQFTLMGGVFSQVAQLSDDAKISLIGMAGGIENLMGLAGQFVNDYYSQGEQAGMQARSIVDALNAVGIDTTNLATREDFRALVESRDVATETGREQLVALLSLGPQFAAVADYIKENDTTLTELVEAAPQVAVLNQILDPTQVTADNTATMANGITESNSLLTRINEKLDAISTVAQSAVSAATSAATAAGAAASAAASAATTVSLSASAPTYTSNLGA